MSTPSTRSDFKEYCLRKLGKPVINIDVSDDQVEDRVDDALKFYYDYHYNGLNKIYYKHQITQTDIDNGYFTLPESIVGVVSIFDMGGAGTYSGMFNIEYQIALTSFFNINSFDAITYWMMIDNLQFIDQLLIGKKPIRYNQHTDRLYVDMNKANLTINSYIVLEAYETLDPTLYPDIWNDRWLIKYATALIKQQWGRNLSKFDGVQLPGGITLNGVKIEQEATQEVETLEQDLIDNYSIMDAFMMG